MKKDLWFLFICAAVMAAQSSLIYGSEVVFPATQLEKGGVSLAVFYGNTAEKLDFNVNSRDQIKVGNNSYFSEVSSDLESDGTSRGVYAKLMFNPANGLYYWLKAGLAGYSLDIPSSLAKNNLTCQNSGWVYGIGARKLLFPDTIVTPAVAIDFGFNYAIYGMDTFRAGGSDPVAVNDKLEIIETQADLVVSKKINIVETYGGLKVYNKAATLTDKSGFANVSGTRNDAGLFFGVKVNYYKQEALLIEGSFIGETNFTAGINIKF